MDIRMSKGNISITVMSFGCQLREGPENCMADRGPSLGILL